MAYFQSGCPEDSNMDSRRCNLRYAKKKNTTPKGVAPESKGRIPEVPISALVLKIAQPFMAGSRSTNAKSSARNDRNFSNTDT
jgi:hypothetical protein